MLSVLQEKKDGYRFCYVLSDGEKRYVGGLTEEGFLTCEAACPYKELMLRTLINKCMNEFVTAIRTADAWGVDLARFGFEAGPGGMYTASFETLALPHDCGH